ncbi:MAG: type II toxin-antitoxin system RelE/ParE family toxin [bacterium]
MNKIEITHHAQKELKKIPLQFRKSIVEKIDQLRADPFPTQSKKLKDAEGYRLRVGHFRVLYKVDKKLKLVTIVTAVPRHKAYRKF